MAHRGCLRLELLLKKSRQSRSTLGLSLIGLWPVEVYIWLGSMNPAREDSRSLEEDETRRRRRPVMPEMATEGNGGCDARDWDEEGYRKSILQERELRCRTVFRTAFAPSQSPNPETVVVASSDGAVASYSLASCISATSQVIGFICVIMEC